MNFINKILKEAIERKFLPHSEAYVRLSPSKISGAGTGVFAIRNIPENVIIFQFDNSEITWVKRSEVEKLPLEIQEMYKDFAVPKGDMMGAPRHFNQMTSAWYINHSRNPNCGCDENFDFYSLREIIKGEELTVDYRTYSDLQGDWL